jgi:hypothetical protein
VMTRSGPLDLLGINRNGDLVVIELKRDRLPRDVIAQAIDYAADVASWSVEKISEICMKYGGESLDDVFASAFPDADLGSISINDSQRIILVGFGAETSLERMIEWLSESYGVNINAVILKYIQTANGAETLARTAILSEEVVEQRTRAKKFTIPMSDEAGKYSDDELRRLLLEYLSQELITAQRIRDILIPACLERGKLSRGQLKREFIRSNPDFEPSKAGFSLSVISGQMGMQKNDFLRQVIGYEYPNNEWEKDNYFVREEYRDLVISVLEQIHQRDGADLGEGGLKRPRLE